MGKYKKLDFVKVLKTLAQRSLDEKWYDVDITDDDEILGDCPFCELAGVNIRRIRYTLKCEACILNQFINEKIIDICGYTYLSKIGNIKDLQKTKDTIIYWLEQIVKYGTIINVGRNIIGNGSVNDQYEFNNVRKND